MNESNPSPETETNGSFKIESNREHDHHEDYVDDRPLHPIFRDTCSICLCHFKHPSLLVPCFHVFCLSCITTWLETDLKTSCPLCKRDVSSVVYDVLSDKEYRQVRLDAGMINNNNNNNSNSRSITTTTTSYNSTTTSSSARSSTSTASSSSSATTNNSRIASNPAAIDTITATNTGATEFDIPVHEHRRRVYVRSLQCNYDRSIHTINFKTVQSQGQQQQQQQQHHNNNKQQESKSDPASNNSDGGGGGTNKKKTTPMIKFIPISKKKQSTAATTSTTTSASTTPASSTSAAAATTTKSQSPQSSYSHRIFASTTEYIAHLEKSSPSLIDRIRKWVERDLQTVLRRKKVNLIADYVMAVLKQLDLNTKREEVHRLLREYLNQDTELFVQELYMFIRSTLRMEAYDRQVTYTDPSTATKAVPSSSSSSSVEVVSTAEERIPCNNNNNNMRKRKHNDQQDEEDEVLLDSNNNNNNNNKKKIASPPPTTTITTAITATATATATPNEGIAATTTTTTNSKIELRERIRAIEEEISEAKAELARVEQEIQREEMEQRMRQISRRKRLEAKRRQRQQQQQQQG